jgi:hypothetical protein
MVMMKIITILNKNNNKFLAFVRSIARAALDGR